uniref:Uncharacterized protein n=1 Tax=Arundo donax TaxID=35708 RepID=A0A0A9HFX0_ARUDO
MSILLRKRRSLTQAGICPLMLREARSRATTRASCPVLHDTPCQSQNISDSFLHESRAPAGSERFDLRHRRACRSASEELWTLDVDVDMEQVHEVTWQMSIATSSSKDLPLPPTMPIMLGCK